MYVYVQSIIGSRKNTNYSQNHRYNRHKGAFIVFAMFIFHPLFFVVVVVAVVVEKYANSPTPFANIMFEHSTRVLVLYYSRLKKKLTHESLLSDE